MKTLIPIVLLASFSGLLAEDGKDFFSVSGSLGSFTKAGVNRSKINTEKGIYPTDSFSTLFGEVNTKYNFLTFIDSDYINRLSLGLGLSAGTLTWDSTRNDGKTWTGNGLTSGSGLNNNYVGGWGGYFADRAYYYQDNRNFMVQNAYLDLGTKYFDFKGGRYESTMDYFSGYTQGFEANIHFKYGIKANNEAKIWWFSSYGRAFAYSEWFLDFYAPKSTLKDNGKRENYGIHAGGIDINYGEFAEFGSHKYGENLLVRPFVYFYPGLYEAPGLKIDYQKYFGKGYGVGFTLQGFGLHVRDKFTTAYDKNNKRYDEKVDRWSGNINAILKAYLFEYNLRLGYYHNIGSANSHFGTYGNPLGFDFWTASVYDIGASISDVINRNAKTIYLSGGGDYNLEYGKFAWEVLGRVTRSPRSDEESIALSLSHLFSNNIKLGLKLEWFRDTTKAGYNPGATLPSSNAIISKRTDDRSHAFITFDYFF